MRYRLTGPFLTNGLSVTEEGSGRGFWDFGNRTSRCNGTKPSLMAPLEQF